MKFNINTSKIRGYKNAFYAVSLILIFAIGIGMTFAPTASAQIGIPQPEKTVGFASVAPTLVGVGQQLTVNLWVFPLPTTYAYKPDWNGFYGLTVTFVRPDGTKDTFMPVDGTGQYVAGETQALGALYFTTYAPSMAGNWSLSFTMPAQNITDSSGTVQYLGCTSNTAYFTVQTTAVLAGLLNGYPWAQLPNSNVYWSYPINANNREWSAISGDWTGITSTMATVNSPTQLRWQPYGTGPTTAHIVWNQPFKAGGIIGGAYGSLNYAATASATLVNPAVITQGKVFVNIPYGTGTAPTPYGTPFGIFRCFDLTTGQLMYTANGSITCGIHLPGNTYAQSATAVAVGETATLLASSYGSDYSSYLFGTNTVNGIAYWNYYDPATGALMMQISNASAARLIDGTALAFGASSGYVYRWNMTSVVNNNWPTGITWKVSLPTPLLAPGATSTGTTQTIFAVSQDLSTIVVYNYDQYWAYNAATGASLWNLTLNYPVTTNEEIPLGGGVDDFLVWNAVASVWDCYSIKTGAFLWATPSVSSSPWATTWTVYYSETNDLNNLYISAPDGTVRAFSLATGQLVWQSTAIPSTEDTENVLPFAYGDPVLVGGNLYEYAGYSPGYQINPVPRFSMMLCINATTGKTEWTLNGGVIPTAASGGYIIGSGIFDGNLYCVGKGPTSTAVTAQQQVGGSVLIQGSVLDTSSGCSSATLTAMFANGVPAISDENMSVWMDYLYMQNSTLLNAPPDCIGVPVTLTAVDSNGNAVTIGTATSDYQGNYGFQWTPTIPGLYHIYATFAGSNSYYTSLASTYATVATAATPVPTASPVTGLATTSDLLTYIVAVAIAIIIAIAIATVLILRKRP
jgi:hypothetical protein